MAAISGGWGGRGMAIVAFGMQAVGGGVGWGEGRGVVCGSHWPYPQYGCYGSPSH
jgi:hypothetical protein